MSRTPAGRGQDAGRRRANVRLALTLASIAAMFFVGVIVSRAVGGLQENGMSFLGLVAMLLLVVAVVHHVRDR